MAFTYQKVNELHVRHPSCKMHRMWGGEAKSPHKRYLVHHSYLSKIAKSLEQTGTSVQISLKVENHLLA